MKAMLELLGLSWGEAARFVGQSRGDTALSRGDTLLIATLCLWFRYVHVSPFQEDVHDLEVRGLSGR